MPRPSQMTPARRRRKSPDGKARSPRVAELPSPLESTPADRKLERAIRDAMNEPEGHRVRDHHETIRDLAFEDIRRVVDLENRISIAWPRFLFIPSEADYRAYWPVPPPDTNRFALDWTSTPIGAVTATREGGELWVWAPSPTVGGAVDSKAEGGLGVLFEATHKLSRIRIEPQLIFTGQHAWSVDVDPHVRVTTRVIGSIYVGAYLQNPVNGRFESIPNVPWRRHVVFDESNSGSGKTPVVILPFNLQGPAASAEVLVEGGRTYLLAVVAQVVLRIRTTDAAGRHVNVTNGRFDTYGAVAGMVRKIWLEETVFIQ